VLLENYSVGLNSGSQFERLLSSTCEHPPLLVLLIIDTTVSDSQHFQELIIEKKGRGRERETTTHLIKIPVFTHASRVTTFLADRREQRG
jgi:hypothetical protein